MRIPPGGDMGMPVWDTATTPVGAPVWAVIPGGAPAMVPPPAWIVLDSWNKYP